MPMAISLGLGLSLSGQGGLRPPFGFVFIIDDDGAYLVDDDGAYLLEAI